MKNGIAYGRSYFKPFYEDLTDSKGYIIVNNGYEFEATIQYDNRPNTVDPDFILHSIFANDKYVILFFVWLKIAYLLRNIVEKKIFEKNTIKIVRIIGLSMLQIPVFNHFAKYYMTKYLKNYPEIMAKFHITLAEPLMIPREFILYICYASVFLFAITEIFRYGLALIRKRLNRITHGNYRKFRRHDGEAQNVAQ